MEYLTAKGKEIENKYLTRWNTISPFLTCWKSHRQNKTLPLNKLNILCFYSIAVIAINDNTEAHFYFVWFLSISESNWTVLGDKLLNRGKISDIPIIELPKDGM